MILYTALVIVAIVGTAILLAEWYWPSRTNGRLEDLPPLSDEMGGTRGLPITRGGRGVMMDGLVVVNKKTMPELPERGTIRIYVGWPNALGNPFIIGRDGDRAEVIRKYKLWLYPQLARSSEPFGPADAFGRIMYWWLVGGYGRVELVCYCAPKPCHADVIVGAARQRLTNDLHDIAIKYGRYWSIV